MSEEEKKAIETLEIEGTENNYLEVKILLNLVEKQQKEIKKEKNRIMELAELLDKQENEIKFLKGELEIQEGCSISKDKIMAKIEELEKQAKEMKYDYDVSYAEEDLFNKNVKFFKEQMQELLEENK